MSLYNNMYTQVLKRIINFKRSKIKRPNYIKLVKIT